MTSIGKNLRHWRWLSDGVLPLALLVMRVCGAWLWLALLAPWLSPSYSGMVLPAAFIFLILLTAMIIVRWGQQLISDIRFLRVVVAAAGLATLLATLWWVHYRPAFALWEWRWLAELGRSLLYWLPDEVPATAVTLLFSIYLWLRGTIDGGRELNHSHIKWAFTGGVLSLVLFVLGIQLSQRQAPSHTGTIIFLFFGTAMVGLSFASLKIVPPSLRKTDDSNRLYLQRYWVGSVGVVIADLLGLGLLLDSVLIPGEIVRILRWTGQILLEGLILLIQLISLLLYPILLGLSRLIPRIMELLRLNTSGLEWLAAVGEMADEFEENNRATPTGDMPEFIRWIVLAVFVALVVLAFGLALRRMLGRKERSDWNETREWILTETLLANQLRDLIPGWLLNGWCRHLRQSPYLDLSGEDDTRRSIRAAYQQLLAMAARAGAPRPRHQPPVAYGRQLSQRWPERAAELDIITSGYQQARYDKTTPTTAVASQVGVAWEALRNHLSILEPGGSDEQS